MRSALGKSSSRALELPFYDSRLSSRLARFKVDHDTIDLLTRHATMAKEHRIVLNTIRISLTPEGGEGEEGEEEEGGEISFLEIREHRPPIRVFTPPSCGYYVTAGGLEDRREERGEEEERKEIPSL